MQVSDLLGDNGWLRPKNLEDLDVDERAVTSAAGMKPRRTAALARDAVR